MGFEEFRMPGRREHDPKYPDWREWLEKRLGEHTQERERGVLKEWQPEMGGTNFDFVCWGDVTELKLWERWGRARSASEPLSTCESGGEKW